MKKAQLMVSALLLVLLLVACAPAAPPAPASRAPAPQAPAPVPALAPVVVSTSPAKPAWEEKWNKTLAEAKKEGTVVVSTTVGPAVRTLLVQGLRDAYGLAAEVVSARSTEINTKVLAERRAGLYLWDVALGGTTSPFTDLEPVGALAPVDTALILPDVTDPELVKKIWYRGGLWWLDSAHLVLATLMTPHPALAINTNLVKPVELKSYNDFLRPEWKGRMILNDPTQPGTTFQSFMIHALGLDYLRQLAKQDLNIMRDERLQVEWLAHGKAAVVLGIKSELYGEWKNLGAPIQSIILAEGSYLTAGSTAVMNYSKAPHPNATSVFVNWLLSKEAQTALSKATLGHSLREDVPTNFLPPEQMRQPGVKYWDKERKEVNLQKAKDIELSKEIFAPLIKK